MMAVAEPLSLQRRLSLWVLALVTLIWLVAALVTWMDARGELGEMLDGQLKQSAALLMFHAEDLDDDITELAVLHKYVPRVEFQVYLAGRLVTRSAGVGATPLCTQPEGFANVHLSDGQNWRTYAAYSQQRNVRILVAENMASRDSILWAVMRRMLWPFVIGLPLLLLGLGWSVRRGLVPVHTLRRTLEERGPDSLEPLTLSGTPTELQPLAVALNQLLQRISRMIQSERRFTADAAHELRTPVAGIRLQAQVALGAGDDASQREHALRQTLAGCDRAAHLVDQLLQLARLEANPAAQAISPEVADLGVVVRRLSDVLSSSAEKRAQRLELQIAGDSTVQGSESLVGVLVRNLLDNALRYCPDGGRVLVMVTGAPHASAVELQVHDSGPGLPPDAIDRLGERFFRVLGTDQSGSGLGWSIINRLLPLFGAQAEIGPSEQLGGLRVRVVWQAPVSQTA